ncbi:hypothetical protein D3C80_1988110 [compost metagenome]
MSGYFNIQMFCILLRRGNRMLALHPLDNKVTERNYSYNQQADVETRTADFMEQGSRNRSSDQDKSAPAFQSA